MTLAGSIESLPKNLTDDKTTFVCDKSGFVALTGLEHIKIKIRPLLDKQLEHYGEKCCHR